MDSTFKSVIREKHGEYNDDGRTQFTVNLYLLMCYIFGDNPLLFQYYGIPLSKHILKDGNNYAELVTFIMDPKNRNNSIFDWCKVYKWFLTHSIDEGIILKSGLSLASPMQVTRDQVLWENSMCDKYNVNNFFVLHNQIDNYTCNSSMFGINFKQQNYGKLATETEIKLYSMKAKQLAVVEASQDKNSSNTNDLNNGSNLDKSKSSVEQIPQELQCQADKDAIFFKNLHNRINNNNNSNNNNNNNNDTVITQRPKVMDDTARESGWAIMGGLTLTNNTETGIGFVGVPENSPLNQLLIDNDLDMIKFQRSLYHQTGVCWGTEKDSYKNHIIDDLDDDFQSSNSDDSDSGVIAAMDGETNNCPEYVKQLLSFLQSNHGIYYQRNFLCQKLDKSRPLTANEQWRVGDKFIDKQNREQIVLQVNNTDETINVQYTSNNQESQISIFTKGNLTHCIHLSRSRIQLNRECIVVSISNKKIYWLNKQCSKSVGNSFYGSWFAFDHLGRQQLLNPDIIGNCALVLNCKTGVLDRHPQISMDKYHLLTPYGHKVHRHDKLQMKFGDKDIFQVVYEPIDMNRFYVTKLTNFNPAARTMQCYNRTELCELFVFWFKKDIIDISSDDDNNDNNNNNNNNNNDEAGSDNDVINEMKDEIEGPITSRGNDVNDEYNIIAIPSVFQTLNTILSMINAMADDVWMAETVLNSAFVSGTPTVNNLQHLNPISAKLIKNECDLSIISDRITGTSCDLDNILYLIYAFETGDFSNLHGQNVAESINYSFDNSDIQQLLTQQDITNDKLLKAIALYFANVDLYLNFLDSDRSNETLQLQFLWDKYYECVRQNSSQIDNHDLQMLMLLVYGNQNKTRLTNSEQAITWSRTTIILQSMTNNNVNDNINEIIGYYILAPHCQYRKNVFYRMLFDFNKKYFIGDSIEEISGKIASMSETTLDQIINKHNFVALFALFEPVFERLYQFCKHCKLSSIGKTITLKQIEKWRLKWHVRHVIEYIGRCIEYSDKWQNGANVTFDPIDIYFNKQYIETKANNALQTLQEFISDNEAQHVVLQYEAYLQSKRFEMLVPTTMDLSMLQSDWDKMYQMWLEKKGVFAMLLNTDPFIELSEIGNLSLHQIKSKSSKIIHNDLIDITMLFSPKLRGYGDKIINTGITVMMDSLALVELAAYLLSVQLLHEKIEHAIIHDKHKDLNLNTQVQSWLLNNVVTSIVVQRKLKSYRVNLSKMNIIKIKIEKNNNNGCNNNNGNPSAVRIHQSGSYHSSNSNSNKIQNQTIKIDKIVSSNSNSNKIIGANKLKHPKLSVVIKIVIKHLVLVQIKKIVVVITTMLVVIFRNIKHK